MNVDEKEKYITTYELDENVKNALFSDKQVALNFPYNKRNGLLSETSFSIDDLRDYVEKDNLSLKVKDVSKLLEHYITILMFRQDWLAIDRMPRTFFVSPKICETYRNRTNNNWDDIMVLLYNESVLLTEYDCIIILDKVELKDKTKDKTRYLCGCFHIDRFTPENPRLSVYSDIDIQKDIELLRETATTWCHMIENMWIAPLINSSDVMDTERPEYSVLEYLHTRFINDHLKHVGSKEMSNSVSVYGYDKPDTEGVFSLMICQFLSQTCMPENKFDFEQFKKVPEKLWKYEIISNLLHKLIRETKLCESCVSLTYDLQTLQESSLPLRPRLISTNNILEINRAIFEIPNIREELGSAIDPSFNKVKELIESLLKVKEPPKGEKDNRSETIDPSLDVHGLGSSMEEPIKKKSKTSDPNEEEGSSEKKSEKMTKTDEFLKGYIGKKIGKFFALHDRTLYQINGGLSGFPIFRRLPPRDKLFNTDYIRMMNINKLQDWILELDKSHKSMKSEKIYSLLSEAERSALDTVYLCMKNYLLLASDVIKNKTTNLDKNSEIVKNARVDKIVLESDEEIPLTDKSGSKSAKKGLFHIGGDQHKRGGWFPSKKSFEAYKSDIIRTLFHYVFKPFYRNYNNNNNKKMDDEQIKKALEDALKLDVSKSKEFGHEKTLEDYLKSIEESFSKKQFEPHEVTELKNLVQYSPKKIYEMMLSFNGFDGLAMDDPKFIKIMQVTIETSKLFGSTYFDVQGSRGLKFKLDKVIRAMAERNEGIAPLYKKEKKIKKNQALDMGKKVSKKESEKKKKDKKEKKEKKGKKGKKSKNDKKEEKKKQGELSKKNPSKDESSDEDTEPVSLDSDDSSEEENKVHLESILINNPFVTNEGIEKDNVEPILNDQESDIIYSLSLNETNRIEVSRADVIVYEKRKKEELLENLKARESMMNAMESWNVIGKRSWCMYQHYIIHCIMRIWPPNDSIWEICFGNSQQAISIADTYLELAKKSEWNEIDHSKYKMMTSGFDEKVDDKNINIMKPIDRSIYLLTKLIYNRNGVEKTKEDDTRNFMVVKVVGATLANTNIACYFMIDELIRKMLSISIAEEEKYSEITPFLRFSIRECYYRYLNLMEHYFDSDSVSYLINDTHNLLRKMSNVDSFLRRTFVENTKIKRWYDQDLLSYSLSKKDFNDSFDSKEPWSSFTKFFFSEQSNGINPLILPKKAIVFNVVGDTEDFWVSSEDGMNQILYHSVINREKDKKSVESVWICLSELDSILPSSISIESRVTLMDKFMYGMEDTASTAKRIIGNSIIVQAMRDYNKDRSNMVRNVIKSYVESRMSTSATETSQSLTLKEKLESDLRKKEGLSFLLLNLNSRSVSWSSIGTIVGIIVSEKNILELFYERQDIGAVLNKLEQNRDNENTKEVTDIIEQRMSVLEAMSTIEETDYTDMIKAKVEERENLLLQLEAIKKDSNKSEEKKKLLSDIEEISASIEIIEALTLTKPSTILSQIQFAKSEISRLLALIDKHGESIPASLVDRVNISYGEEFQEEPSPSPTSTPTPTPSSTLFITANDLWVRISDLKKQIDKNNDRLSNTYNYFMEHVKTKELNGKGNLITMMDEFVFLNPPHDLNSSERKNEYVNWSIMNSFSDIVPIKSDYRIRSNGMICGLSHKTKSIGDDYLKDKLYALNELELKLALSKNGFNKSEIEEAVNVYREHDVHTFPAVGSEPEYGSYHWKENDKAMILASKNFWKYVPYSTASRIAYKMITTKETVEVIQKELVKEYNQRKESLGKSTEEPLILKVIDISKQEKINKINNCIPLQSPTVKVSTDKEPTKVVSNNANSTLPKPKRLTSQSPLPSSPKPDRPSVLPKRTSEVEKKTDKKRVLFV